MKSYYRPEIRIGNRRIGFNNPCFIIAEVGSNHNRNLSVAKELIDAAAKAGADAVKFQTVKFSELYLNVGTDKKTKRFIKSLELEEKWYPELKEEAEKKGLIFLSTPTYMRAIDLLFDMRVKAFKIASAQAASDLSLISYAASKGLPLFISTGLIDFKRVRKILDICRREDNNRIVLLHCVSAYPTPANRASLLRMIELKDRFKAIVGYSDHSLGKHFPIAAAALGAKVIEKHFTLSRKMKGPDHFFSLEPKELIAMIKEIRETEVGLPVKNRPSPMESEFKKSVQLKWVAAKDFSKGERLDEDFLMARRTSVGIDIEKPLSCYLCSRDIKKGMIIKKSFLKSR